MTGVARSHETLRSSALYCLRIKEKAGLSQPFSTVLEDRKHSIIYIGIASQSLRKRLNQEIRAKGHCTFFRSIGAVLGFTPLQGSLVGKLNQNNYKFSKIDEKKIITWINEILMVNWVSFEENLAGIEILLLQMHSTLLNIAGNPGALEEIRQLRETCKI
jgi:hypothetical protein